MEDVISFREALIEWYASHRRDLPWRATQDPYKIWLSEIILQQTRVAQGLKYYESFVEQYPTVKDLAAADEDEVLSLWKGLGYYSRARNLHYTAQVIVKDYGGVFPPIYDEIIRLKGIGSYTAAAICSFAFQQPYPVIDGNVVRVISRLYGITDPVDSRDTRSKILQIVESLYDRDRPDEYNQAIMEFGALQCKPKSPDCGSCPFGSTCIAYLEGVVDVIPTKEKKIKRYKRYFHYLIIQDADRVWLRKRLGKDIWQGLYEFHLHESNDDTQLSHQVIESELSVLGIEQFTLDEVSEIRIQKLTHRDIHARFYHVSVPDLEGLTNDNYFLEDQKKTSNFALPKIIVNYLSED